MRDVSVDLFDILGGMNQPMSDRARIGVSNAVASETTYTEK